MYKLSGRKARWTGRVLDRSLSSGLCHGRCACMAGQKKYLNKKITIFGSEGRRHGVYFCPGSPLWCVVCAICPFLLFCLLFLLAPNRKQSDMDSGQLRPHRNLVAKGINLSKSISIDFINLIMLNKACNSHREHIITCTMN
ncbi:unnamed protein product [Malus baccata var. baccata]